MNSRPVKAQSETLFKTKQMHGSFLQWHLKIFSFEVLYFQSTSPLKFKVVINVIQKMTTRAWTVRRGSSVSISLQTLNNVCSPNLWLYDSYHFEIILFTIHTYICLVIEGHKTGLHFFLFSVAGNQSMVLGHVRLMHCQ